MRKLTKDDLKERDRLADELDRVHSQLEAAVTEFNSKMDEIYQPLQKAVEAYNEVREEVNDFASGIATDIQSYIDDRSEAWHDSDAAQVMDDWKTVWDEEIDELEIDKPDEVELDSDLAEGDYLRDKEESVDSLG